MEYVLKGPQIQSLFSKLGAKDLHETYKISENCRDTLRTILKEIYSEDVGLRSFRRNISCGQHIKKDLVPVLLHAEDETIKELVIKILMHLTTPVECLMSVDVISQTQFGKNIIFEINHLLVTAKVSFTDQKVTKAIIEVLKKNADIDKPGLSLRQCKNISNCLLLLRNILHIDENMPTMIQVTNDTDCTMQNQILWNIFTQSIDKILIKLMNTTEAPNWGMTMVQLIALLYKDQHVVTLHKLLNLWLEASMCESSEDNESNTSPTDRRSEDSSPILTSEPTSDSSDTGGQSGKSMNDSQFHTDQADSNESMEWQTSPDSNTVESKEKKSDASEVNNEPNKKDDTTTEITDITPVQPQQGTGGVEAKVIVSETSDCGYGTQIENQGAMSTSSNDDDLPSKRPVHMKPHNSKKRPNTKGRCLQHKLQDPRRKKIVKRAKANITMNVQGVSHKTPTDEDISNVLKEFTVDFLLKGYNPLVQSLHKQMLSNVNVETDTSHFFWLITYFLKFATQIELDMEHIWSVLSIDIVSYLTAEGVNITEQFEIATKVDHFSMKTNMPRIHLVVTAIREFVQAVETYRKLNHLCEDEQKSLVDLQIKMVDMEELRSLLILLLRHYNPEYQSKQYLKDLIVTNHMMLMFLDSVIKLPEYNGTFDIVDHIRHFATTAMMKPYGLLLEDYENNGEYVNDCIFTLMHHVAGELGSLVSLYQPCILKTFTSIWESKFEICDDWFDLIEYVINTFIKKPDTLQIPTHVRLDVENFEIDSKPSESKKGQKSYNGREYAGTKMDITPPKMELAENWTPEELSALNWAFMQCSNNPDVVGDVVKIYKEDGIAKSREAVAKELYKQNFINKEKFDHFMQQENATNTSNETKAQNTEEDVTNLAKIIANEGNAKCLKWVQKVLLDTCFAKIYIQKNNEMKKENDTEDKMEHGSVPPISYYFSLKEQSVPLVPWNCEQAAMCRDLKVIHLLTKLGFHMPLTTGKVFLRIPHYWSTDQLYQLASKLAPIDPTTLKFSPSDMTTDSLHVQSLRLLPPTASVAVNSPDPMIHFMAKPGTSFGGQAPQRPACSSKLSTWLDIVQRSRYLKTAESSFVDPAFKPPEDDARSDLSMRGSWGSSDKLDGMGDFLCDMPEDLIGPHSPAPSDYDRSLENSPSRTQVESPTFDRMYVSDCSTGREHDDDDQHSSDSEQGSARKRPRVQFTRY